MPMLRVSRPIVYLTTAFVAAMALLAAAFSPSPTSVAGASARDGSGGRAVAHLAGGKRTDAANRPDARASHVLYKGKPMRTGEPTLGFDDDGDLYFIAFRDQLSVGPPRLLEVMYSKDEATTWEPRSPYLAGQNIHQVTLDPYVYVDPWTNRVFTIDLTVACSYMSFSDDKGKSWITNPLACGRPVNDHQTLFAGPPVNSPTVGYDNIVYYCWNDVGTSSCGKSLDGGLTFHPTGSPAYPGFDPAAAGQGDGFCGGLHGHGHVGYDGTVYLPKDHCGTPWLSISRDEGRTWTRVQVSDQPTADNDPSVATDRKGNIYYMWTDRDRQPNLAISRDGGETWSKPMEIGAPGLREASLPSLAVGDPGKIAFVYYGSENSPFKGWTKECRNNSRCGKDYTKTTWNGYIGMSANALDRNPVFYTSTVNAKDDPLVFGTTCGPGRCPVAIDFIDVVIAPDGKPWGAFVDGCLTDPCPINTSSELGGIALAGRLVGGPRLR